MEWTYKYRSKEKKIGIIGSRENSNRDENSRSMKDKVVNNGVLVEWIV